MSAPDLTLAIRDAIVAETAVTSLLSAYLGSFPVFTRRPVPDDTPYPCIVISKNISLSEEDGLNDFRPVIARDVAVYNRNEPAANYHDIDAIASAIRDMFHRQQPLTVPDWSVTLILASGPIDFRLEQEKLTGRVVQLMIRVAQQR